MPTEEPPVIVTINEEAQSAEDVTEEEAEPEEVEPGPSEGEDANVTVIINVGDTQPEPAVESEPEPVEVPEIIEEAIMQTYKDFSEYHFPEGLVGKTIEDEGGQRYTFGANGITLPIDYRLYPNPVTPDMFNRAIDGTTSESVTDGVDTFFYELSMSGKFEYKGNQYYGEVVITVEAGDELLLNGKPAVFIE
jgi:hypothetical protein